MKLLIEKNILQESLNYVSKALSTKNIIPVLNGIKFELNNEGLSLTATDNDITIKTLIDKKDIKKIEEEGCTVIYSKSLLEIMRKLSNTDILIENFEDNKISFTTESGAVYNFSCFLKEDFPNINLETKQDYIKVNSNDLKTMINQTVFACSLQESRPLLTGVNIKITGDLLECIATDSYRLSKKIIKLDRPTTENINIIVPSRNINELIKVIDSDDEIEIHTFSNKIIFKQENIIFQSSLLNGTYPNTDNSIPRDFKYKIKLNLKEFYNIIDRASSISQSKDKNIVDFEIIKNKLIIKAASLESKMEESMNVENETENDIKISFSAKFMLEALKILETEEIYILLNGEISPIILKETGNENLIELILPMKTF